MLLGIRPCQIEPELGNISHAFITFSRCEVYEAMNSSENMLIEEKEKLAEYWRFHHLMCSQKNIKYSFNSMAIVDSLLLAEH